MISFFYKTYQIFSKYSISVTFQMELFHAKKTFCNVTVVAITYSFLLAKVLHSRVYILPPLSKFTLSFLTMTFEKVNLVFEDNSLHFVRIFLKLFKGLIFVAILLLPTSIIIRSGSDWKISSTSSLIFLVVALGKFLTFT